MAVSTLLDAAARAFAMVSLSDGNLSPSEEHRFARFVAGDAALKSARPLTSAPPGRRR